MIDAQVQELLDKQAIREALDRYARGVDRLDAALIASAYHDDAVDDRGPMGTWHGGAEAAERLIASMGTSMAMTTHHLTNVIIALDGDTAGVETYTWGVHAPLAGGEPRRMLTSGRYLDRFERRDGEWRIAHRRNISDMVRMVSLDDEIDLGPAQSRRDRTDPSYDLPG
jgi:ketosteroid isomerase-like protein